MKKDKTLVETLVETTKKYDMRPEDIPQLQFFSYAHLPSELAQVSKMFGDVAINLVSMLPDNDQTKLCLQRLLEAKDCAVRSVIYRK